MIKAKFKEYFGLTNQAVKELADNKLQVEEPSTLELEIKNKDRIAVPDCFDDTPEVLRTEAQYLYELSDTQIIGPRPIVKINGQYFSATAMDNYLENEDFPTKYAFRDMFLESPGRHIESAFLMYGRRIDAYFHWFHENLKKVHWYLQYVEKNGSNPTLLIPASLPEWGKDSLHLLGFESSDIYEVGHEILEVETLIIPSHPRSKADGTHRHSSRHMNWVRETMLKNNSSEGEAPKRIYISRDDANRRVVKNEDEFVSTLKHFGFERYYLSEIPLEKQIELFANVNYILGPHGAGLTNMIWSSNASVIEMIHSGTNDTFFVLANEMGHHYNALPVNKVDKESHSNPHHYDFIVNPSKAKSIIKYII